jgi:hypothetical protein
VKKTIKRSLHLPVVLFLCAGSLAGQNIEFPDWDAAVELEMLVSTESISPGDEIEIEVHIKVEPGYHIYGPEENPPNRTELVLGESPNLKWGSPSFPPVTKKDLAGLGEFDLFEGDISIFVPASVSSSSTKNSKIEAEIEVKYQVCTDGACSPPTSTVLRKSFVVSETSTKP